MPPGSSIAIAGSRQPHTLGGEALGSSVGKAEQLAGLVLVLAVQSLSGDLDAAEQTAGDVPESGVLVGAPIARPELAAT